jgi:hypothetical protein
VASWLTAAAPGKVADESPPALPPEDPVIALVAEERRLEELWGAADEKGHDREANAIDKQMGAILNQLRNRNIKPVTIAGAIAMIELGLRCFPDISFRFAETDGPLIDAAIASLRDLQPKALRTSHGDDRILSLFREWVAAKRHMSAVPDEEYEAASAVLGDLEDTINETPSRGAAGLAIKSYLSLHIECGFCDPKDAAALDEKAINYEVHASILKDAVSFVPELAPLAVAAFAHHAERELSDPERDVIKLLKECGYKSGKTTDVIGFGDPEEGGAA